MEMDGRSYGANDEWQSTPQRPQGARSTGQKAMTGHLPLAIGAWMVAGGYAAVFVLGAIGVRPLIYVGTLCAMAGFIVWVVGMVMRLVHNSKFHDLPFTNGEKAALVGGAVAVFGMFMLNGADSDSGETGVRMIGLVGIVVVIAGLIWHTLSPRQSSR